MSDVDVTMRAVLTQLELTSNGRTASFDSSGGGDSEPAAPALGLHDAPHLEYARRYASCLVDEDRWKVVRAAERELAGVRRRPTPPPGGSWETLEQRNARIVKEGAGHPARAVAVSMKCGERDVERARIAAGRDPEFGRPMRTVKPAIQRGRDEHRAAGRFAPDPEKPERADDARRMADKGMTARQIAFSLGVSYDTVRRYLGRR